MNDSEHCHDTVIELKSKRCERFSLVRFLPKTSRNVDIFWIDYNGRKVKYGTLNSNRHLDVKTFESHPWVFRDSETGDNLVVTGGSDVYFPVQWTGGDRTFVYIDIPVYTLKERCLQKVRKMYTKEEIKSFLIPHTLKSDAVTDKMEPYDVYMYFQPVIH